MPVRRGHMAPRTTIIETIIRKFDTHNRSFLVANSHLGLCHIIYCSDGFCRLTGFSRAEVMQQDAICKFLHGPLTSQHAVQVVKEALAAGAEKHFEILYYKKDGTKFLCSEVIAPVRSEVDDISLYIINFEDLTAPQSPIDESEPVHRLSKFDRARQSFRQSFRMGSLRGRGVRRGENMAPLPSDDGEDTRLAKASSEGDTTLVPADRTLRPLRLLGMERSQTTELNTKSISNHITAKRPSVPTEAAMPKRNSISFWEDPPPLHMPDLNQNIYKDQTHFPSDQPTSASSAQSKSPVDQSAPSSPQVAPSSPKASILSTPQVPHAASLETISLKRPRLSSDIVHHHHIPNVQIATNRPTTEKSTTCSASSRHHPVKHFPNTSSESDLQRYRASSVWDHAPSLGNVANVSDSFRTKISKQYSTQDNGSAKFFQGALHAPNMGEKVAQVLSLGADVLPEYKLQTPRIHKWTILHYSPFKAVWDWLILILVVYTAIFTPYVAAFLLNEPDFTNRTRNRRYSDPIVFVDLIVDVTFIVDIAINFRTTYVNANDEVVSNPGLIALHYLRGWFIIDLVAAIPFDLLFFGSTPAQVEPTSPDSDKSTDTDTETTTLIGLLKTARLLRLVRVARKIDRYSEYGAAVLLLLMATFALIAHWLACIWYAIGNAEKSSVGWLDILANDTHQFYQNGTGGPSIKSRYVTALYFTFSSLTSVGFGNVAPNTDNEKIFTILVMLVGSLMYASIFGNVSAIIQRLYSGTARYHTQMLRVREFIRFHQIPNPLRQRLEEYFQHAWTYTNGIDMNSVLKGFPECLQADICLHLNRNLLSDCSAFKGASPGCLRALSLKFKTTHAPPGDTLVHKGDVLTSLYFISRGSIEILRDDVVMAILGKDDIYGENPCLHTTIGKSSSNVRALTYCDLHKIHRDDLLDVLDLYPEFYNSFSENLEITFYMRDEEQAGVDPRCGRHVRRRSGSSSNDRPTVDVGGGGGLEIDIRRFPSRPARTRTFNQDSLESAAAAMFSDVMNDDHMDDFGFESKNNGHHGILEFSTDKAGQDVTPMNLDFSESNGQQPKRGMNSISGMFNQLKRSLTDIRLHGISTKLAHDASVGRSYASEARLKRSCSSFSMKPALQDPTSVLVEARETQPLLDHQVPISDSGVPFAQLGDPISHIGSSGNMTTGGSSHYSTPSLSPLHSYQHNNQKPYPQPAPAAGVSTVISSSLPQPTSYIPQHCTHCGTQVNARVDNLSRQLDSLEQSVASDIRLILSILRQQNSRSSDSVTLPESREQCSSDLSSIRLRPPPVQRSSSVPQNNNPSYPHSSVSTAQLRSTSTQDNANADSILPPHWRGVSPLRVTAEAQPHLTTIPRRTRSQPVDLSQPSRVSEEWLCGQSQTNTSTFSSDQRRADKGEPATQRVPGNGSGSGSGEKKRQLFASRSAVSDDGTDMTEFSMSPVHRLDSLHETETTSTTGVEPATTGEQNIGSDSSPV
uniref:Potassium voltage-gated channel subfamily H member 7 n=1 Tax=Cacopsylla melanoneura TaxID=428564 RepID=A0A8D9A862_9HEMI